MGSLLKTKQLIKFANQYDNLLYVSVTHTFCSYFFKGNCPYGQFECHPEHCIDEEQRCNFILDCPDDIDEHGCSELIFIENGFGFYFSYFCRKAKPNKNACVHFY